MGKYDDIVDDLPRSWGTDPGFQEKVNAVKQEILNSTPEQHQELTTDVVEELIDDIVVQQKVLNNMLIQGMGGKLHGDRAAKLYAHVRIMKSAFEEQEKITNTLEEAYKQILVDQYEAEGVKSLALRGIGTIRTEPGPHGKVVDKDANRKWAIKEGLENLLSIPWQTVNALTKQALLEGREPPDGVEAETRVKVVFTKEK